MLIFYNEIHSTNSLTTSKNSNNNNNNTYNLLLEINLLENRKIIFYKYFYTEFC